MKVNLITTALQKRGAVPRKARIQGSQIFVSLNSRLESNEKIKQKKRFGTWWRFIHIQGEVPI